ncbi:hypothetical protein GCM10022215_14500 [Nocardioides fonticola]|uniref:MarR family transcriptional regulator n=1 Tax=Nocardioides fonticola TaxID=450363 RepID=A0ABP7XH43_9ACTN
MTDPRTASPAAPAAPAFLALHALRLRGTVQPELAAEIAGLEAAEAEQLLRAAEAAGHVSFHEGRRGGFRLTDAGREQYAVLLAADTAGAEATAALEAAYEAFLPANVRLKEVTTAWQMRDGAPNDHTDAAYDAGVIDDLAALDADVQGPLRDGAAGCPRLGTYAERLAAVLGRLRGGDIAAFARPLANSYHDIWMELHQDLLLSLGRERSAADGH